MDPTQSVIAGAELSGIVGDNDGIAEQVVVSNSVPYGRRCEKADELVIENVDALAGQVFEESDLVHEDSGRTVLELCHDRLFGTLRVQPVHGFMVEDIILMSRPQDRKEVEP